MADRGPLQSFGGLGSSQVEVDDEMEEGEERANALARLTGGGVFFRAPRRDIQRGECTSTSTNGSAGEDPKKKAKNWLVSKEASARWSDWVVKYLVQGSQHRYPAACVGDGCLSGSPTRGWWSALTELRKGSTRKLVLGADSWRYVGCWECWGCWRCARMGPARANQDQAGRKAV